MKFLENEMQGLSDTHRQIILTQLERCIQEINAYFRDATYNDMSHDLALHRSAAKIYAILDWAKKFKTSIEQE